MSCIADRDMPGEEKSRIPAACAKDTCRRCGQREALSLRRICSPGRWGNDQREALCLRRICSRWGNDRASSSPMLQVA